MTALVAGGVTGDIDVAFTRLVQSFASDPLDLAANGNTLFGQPAVSVAIAGALALVAWRRGPPQAWLATLLFGAVVGVGLLLKLVLVHPPPPHEFVRALWNPLGTQISTPSAFPSGHVSRLTFLALFAMGLTGSTWLRAALVAFVAYTAWARVYIGDHWLSDGLGGLALGIAAGCAALIWIERRRAYARP